MINNINITLGVTSYSLAQFVEEYLRIQQPKLAQIKIDTQEKLK